MRKISLPENGRTICISDIHGAYDAFRALLDKINFSENDTLILLGDLYTKGKQGRETLEYIMEQCALPNVYALRGNCDWVEPWADANQRAWLEALPHILESDEFIFVHGGIGPGELTEQRAIECMKNDAWLDKCGAFDRWVITGHWPTVNYANTPRASAARISSVNSAELSSTCDGVFSCDPVIDGARRVIAIDGGMVVKPWGQLNAFIIERGGFSFEAVDFMPIITAEKDQMASENPLTITWNDRFIEELPDGIGPSARIDNGAPDGARPNAEFGKYLHLATGRTIELPRDQVWRDKNGRLCDANGTDYRLPVRAGDKMSLLREYGDRLFVKKDGQIGWVFK
ncbi:MAG: metallophosphoesterase [Oscillospiraceae bacterium]|nr:metallophosphoesterase [Oscillospiraceae bacterium]